MNGFNPALEFTLNLAFKQARQKLHKFFTVEHLVLALLDNSDVSKILKQFSQVDVEELRQRLSGFVDRTTPMISFSDKDKDTQPTLSVQRVLQRAMFRAQSEHLIEINGIDVLEAVFGEKVSKSVDFLKEAGITLQDIRNYIPISRQTAKAAYKTAAKFEEEVSEPTYLINLTEKARAGKLNEIISRDDEILQTIQILCRRQKNNPLLIGEPGVGKTAIIEGLAQKIIKKEVPDQLSGSIIYSLDITSLLAGTQYRGEFEKRVQNVLNEIRQKPRSILFIDEIHMIVGAGATSSSAIDLANLLKPILTSDEFRFIGATTYKEYRHIFEKDQAMARRFQTVDIAEPTPDQTLEILKGIKKRFEKHYGVEYTDEAIRSAVDLSVRYIHDRFLPDKAIDIIDDAGASYALLPVSARKGIIDVKDIERIISKIAHIPEISVSISDKMLLKDLDSELKRVIYGQDDAIDVVSSAIRLSSAGLREEDKPIGSFLFVGPTGVGKTEVAKQLSRILGIELLRYDMSEYKESHTISRLIGAPPGYVGHDKGGLLTDEVNKHPHCVLLLDEMEKAHPDVYNLLLQIMDYGMLTDSSGHKTDFRHAIIIMTTNVGADLMSRRSIGFTTEEHFKDGMLEVNKAFSPEFRNRLDAIVQFTSLDATTIANVVNKLIGDLALQLKQKNVELEVDENARLWFAERGYDRYMGARPMKKLIQEQLKKPLADELLFGKLIQGGKVLVSAKEGNLSISLSETVSNNTVK